MLWESCLDSLPAVCLEGPEPAFRGTVRLTGPDGQPLRATRVTIRSCGNWQTLPTDPMAEQIYRGCRTVDSHTLTTDSDGSLDLFLPMAAYWITHRDRSRGGLVVSCSALLSWTERGPDRRDVTLEVAATYGDVKKD